MFDFADLEPVPDGLAEIIDPVLADMQRPRPVPLALGIEPTAYGPDLLWVSEKVPDSGAAGFSLSSDTPLELTVQFADWLQEQVFPETRGAWGEARPECPGHTHPAIPIESDGEAWWVCPVHDTRIARIGTLG